MKTLRTIFSRKFIAACLLALIPALTPIAVHALSSANGDFEAETATSFSGGAVAGSQTVASGGRTVRFYSNGTISKTVTTPAVNVITVTARGTQCKGAPQMTVKIDGVVVMTNQNVASTTYAKYAASLANVKAGKHTVSISYNNDFKSRSCDRNLLVDKVEFTPSTTGDTVAPTVLITSPANDSIINGFIRAEANASDNSGVIKHVDFYLDYAATPTKVEYNAPYCLAGNTTGTPCNRWDTTKLADGSHTLTAKAYDAAGNIGTTTNNFAISNTPTTTPPPPVTIAPINDTAAAGGKALQFRSNGRAKKTTTTPAVNAITITARGTQCNGAPTMAVKIDGNAVLNADVTSTTYKAYKTSLTNGNAGSHTVTIEYANDLYLGAGCDRNLIVDKIEFTPVPPSTTPDTTAPTANVITPTNGSTVSGLVAAQATATDNPGGKGVKLVEFFVDGGTSPLSSATVAPYCLAGANGATCKGWDTTKLPNGKHTISVRATDAANNVGSLSTVSFTVSNSVVVTPPPPPPTGGSGSILSVLQYDMACANGQNPGCPADGSTITREAKPNNYDNNDWAKHARVTTNVWRSGALACRKGTNPPVPCTTLAPWGALYQQEGGNRTAAKVQIANIQAWGLYDDNQWHKLGPTDPGAPAPAQGNLFPEQWCIKNSSGTCVVVPGGDSRAATTSQLPDRSTTVQLPQCQNITVNGGATNYCSYLYHFWGSTHINLTSSSLPSVRTLKTVVTFVRARIDPATYDPNAKYVLSDGQDRWGSNNENGWDSGVGRFKIVDKNWRVFSSSSALIDTSLPNPVPPTVEGVLSNSEFR